jgi:hypothetical protein
LQTENAVNQTAIKQNKFKAVSTTQFNNQTKKTKQNDAVLAGAAKN